MRTTDLLRTTLATLTHLPSAMQRWNDPTRMGADAPSLVTLREMLRHVWKREAKLVRLRRVFWTEQSVRAERQELWARAEQAEWDRVRAAETEPAE